MPGTIRAAFALPPRALTPRALVQSRVHKGRPGRLMNRLTPLLTFVALMFMLPTPYSYCAHRRQGLLLHRDLSYADSGHYPYAFDTEKRRGGISRQDDMCQTTHQHEPMLRPSPLAIASAPPGPSLAKLSMSASQVGGGRHGVGGGSTGHEVRAQIALLFPGSALVRMYALRGCVASLSHHSLCNLASLLHPSLPIAGPLLRRDHRGDGHARLVHAPSDRGDATGQRPLRSA